MALLGFELGQQEERFLVVAPYKDDNPNNQRGVNTFSRHFKCKNKDANVRIIVFFFF